MICIFVCVPQVCHKEWGSAVLSTVANPVHQCWWWRDGGTLQQPHHEASPGPHTCCYSILPCSQGQYLARYIMKGSQWLLLILLTSSSLTYIFRKEGQVVYSTVPEYKLVYMERKVRNFYITRTFPYTVILREADWTIIWPGVQHGTWGLGGLQQSPSSTRTHSFWCQ